MEHQVRLNLATGALVAAVALSVSVIVSVTIGARAYKSRAVAQSQQTQWIAVKGSARQRITSDLAVWTVGVSGEAADLPQAYAALDRGEAELKAYFAASGIQDTEIALAAITTETHLKRDKDGRETREILSYELRRTITVRTPSVQRVATAAAGVTRLLQKGVFVDSTRPQYTYRGLPDLRVSILGDASKDARTRAEEIARNTGCKIAEVRSVQMSPLQVVAPDSTEVSSYGSYDTSTIEKDVTAVVNVTFAVATP